MGLSGRLAEDWESPDSLGDEITYVAAKYNRVTFDHVDIHKRMATIAMNGPWGIDNKTVYVKVDIKFPLDYPEKSPPAFEIERTTSILPETLDEMLHGLDYISRKYTSHHRYSLEASTSYLLGERDLSESTSWLTKSHADGELDPDILAGQLSSDDEDNLEIGQNVPVHDMENSGTEVLGTIISNANVPLPKACGAMFARDGRLICFFPPKEKKAKGAIGHLFSKDVERLTKVNRKFGGFGRLAAGSPETKATIFSLQRDQEDNSDSEDSYTSSSGSSGLSEDLMDTKLGGFPRWRRARAHERRFPKALSTDNSQLSAGQGSGSLKAAPPAPKNIVCIHRLDELIPAKKILAEEYVILGDGPSVCRHNATVARRHGFPDLADFWEFARLILHNQVPLEALELPFHEDPILVMEKRAVSPLHRKDSGLDLAYDEAMSNPPKHLTGRVRWGQHPLGRAWLIEAM